MDHNRSSSPRGRYSEPSPYRNGVSSQPVPYPTGSTTTDTNTQTSSPHPATYGTSSAAYGPDTHYYGYNMADSEPLGYPTAYHAPPPRPSSSIGSSAGDYVGVTGNNADASTLFPGNSVANSNNSVPYHSQEYTRPAYSRPDYTRSEHSHNGRPNGGPNGPRQPHLFSAGETYDLNNDHDNDRDDNTSVVAPYPLEEFRTYSRNNDHNASYGIGTGFSGIPQANYYPEEPGSGLLPHYDSKPLHSYFHTSRDYDSDEGEDYVEDEESFTPFPVTGDQYDLNTFQTDTASGSATDNGEDEEDDDYETDASDISEETTPFGEDVMPPPVQERREKPTIVKLFRGNFVLDFRVSNILRSQFPELTEREFTYMRYTAVTCGPEDFVAKNFTLRQTCYMQPRATEIFIVITLYNENDILLARTLQGVFQNIRNLVRRKNSHSWNSESWKKVVVCIVADGRKKINPRTQALLAALGVYQPGFGMSKVNQDPVQAHLYEYTTMLDVWVQGNSIKLERTKSCPVQLMFCLKEENKQKINSHRWFFQAFCPILAPKICVLIDAGTQPSSKSIYHLWKTFDVHGNVGGACGEIRASLGTGWHKLYNPLVAAQNFEYKMSNILDKPLESVFGFISVLPGAFSAYRYLAIQGGPLDKYYLGETKGADIISSHGGQGYLQPPPLQTLDGSHTMMLDDPPEHIGQDGFDEKDQEKHKKKKRKFGIFDANMYLAEDRILCFELVTQRHSRWVSKYVKSAYAETDVPESLSELVMQRRRWLNGSFFAAIYSQVHFFAIWKSGHSIGRKIALQIEFFYQMVSMLFSWFSIGNFFLVFKILTGSLGDSSLGFAPGAVLSTIFLWVYAGSLITMFVLSFGNRPKGTQYMYILITSFFAILMAYLIFAAIFISVKSVEYAICSNGGFSAKLAFENVTFRDLIVSVLSTYALYFLSSFLFFEPWHMFTSFLQYLLVSPAYINVLNVYAFCNIHDISWGTKSDGKAEELGTAQIADKEQGFAVSGGIPPVQTQKIDELYMKQIEMLKDPPVEEKVVPSEKERTTDFYAMFRSVVVLVWIFTNMALAVVVLNTAGMNVFTNSDSSTSSSSTSTTSKRMVDTMASLGRRAFVSGDGVPTLLGKAILTRATSSDDCSAVGGSDTEQTQIYLSVILWTVAALAAFRFTGAVSYMILRFIGR